MTARPLSVLVNAVNDNALPRGPDRYLLELIPRLLLADPGLRISVLHAPWQKAFLEARFGPRVELRSVAAPRAPALRLLWQAAAFPRLANRTGARVVFLPNLIWVPGLKAPSVLTAHDLLHFRHPEKFGRLKAALLRQIIRRAIRAADRLIAVSEFTAADMLHFGRADPARLTVIPEGGPSPEPRGHALPDRFFLFVGKLERSKGVVDLIDAFRGSRRLTQSGFRLVLVGAEGNAAGDVARALHGAGSQIERRGFVPADELRALYRSCRGFAFPSVAEGFGLVVLEAMAHGAPVIAARATALPEVVGEAGILVPPGDIGALRTALERLAFDDAIFASLQAAGLTRLASFSWEKAGAETAALFREVAQC
jgi:glycosyltransferase involved in cell wall biosynthesis